MARPKKSGISTPREGKPLLPEMPLPSRNEKKQAARDDNEETTNRLFQKSLGKLKDRDLTGGGKYI